MKNTNKVTIIIVGGMVGTGKSTVVDVLRKALVIKDICTLRLTAYPNVSYAFFTLLALLFYRRRKILKFYRSGGIHPSTLVIKRFNKLNSLFITLITFIEILSLCLWVLYMYIKCKGSKIVIIDEGFINVVANYMEVLGRNSSKLIYFVFKLLRRWSYRYRLLLIFLKADYSILMGRWAKRRRPIITSFIDLNYHILYQRLMMISLKMFLTSGFNIVLIDTSHKGVYDTIHEVIEIVRHNLKIAEKCFTNNK